MFRILDRYIGKTIFNTIIVTMFILVSLSGIIKFVEQLRKIGQGKYSALDACLFTILSIPKDIEIFFPMAVLLGALLGLGSLSNHSELIATLTFGFSRLQVVTSVMKIAIPLVLLTMTISEWVVPTSEQIAYSYRTQAIYGNSILSNQNGLWVRDGNDFIFIERIVTRNELSGVNIYHFNESQQLESLYRADAAYFYNGSWKLKKVDESDLTNDKQIISRQNLNGEWKTSLTPDKLRTVALEPNSMSILRLYNLVDYLKQSGQTFSRYQLNMWSKIFSPLSVIVMLMMALSFVFGPLRNVSIGIQIITGISFGFLFYVLDQIFGPLSLVYNFPPVLGAMLPSMIFLIIGIITLLKNQ